MSKGDVQLEQLTAAGNSEKEKAVEASASGTEFDSTTPAIYSTISEAQKQHTSYKSSQVRNAEATGVVTTSHPAPTAPELSPL